MVVSTIFYLSNLDGFAKSPFAALRSSCVTAAYLYVRLIPQHTPSLASGAFCFAIATKKICECINNDSSRKMIRTRYKRKTGIKHKIGTGYKPAPILMEQKKYLVIRRRVSYSTLPGRARLRPHPGSWGRLPGTR